MVASDPRLGKASAAPEGSPKVQSDRDTHRTLFGELNRRDRDIKSPCPTVRFFLKQVFTRTQRPSKRLSEGSAGSKRITPVSIAGRWKLISSSRLCAIHCPARHCVSQCPERGQSSAAPVDPFEPVRALGPDHMDSPSIGFWRRWFCTIEASPSWPLRMSSGSLAANIQTVCDGVITWPSPARYGRSAPRASRDQDERRRPV